LGLQEGSPAWTYLNTVYYNQPSQKHSPIIIHGYCENEVGENYFAHLKNLKGKDEVA